MDRGPAPLPCRVALALALAGAGCTRLFFFPSRLDYTARGPVQGTLELVEFPAADGRRVTGLWLAPREVWEPS